jgi:hypothetical protein
LERADDVLGEIAQVMWPGVASVWRIPPAAVVRDSMRRLEVLAARRRVRPPQLNLLIVSIVSPLLLSKIFGRSCQLITPS